jgi:hypothetical protein
LLGATPGVLLVLPGYTLPAMFQTLNIHNLCISFATQELM